MNTKSFKAITATFAISVFSLACAHAQTVIDSTTQSVTGAAAINFSDWNGNKFVNDATSRNLQSITLSMDVAADTSGSFRVELYSNSGSLPGSSLGILTGNGNPATAGLYTYTPSSTITLNPNTTYWVVAKVTSGLGDYSWNYTSTTTHGGTGTLGGFSESFDQGGSWSAENVSFPSMFSVTATAVPEPSSYAAMLGVAALGFGIFNRRFRRA